ncbi:MULTISPECIES: hypothetical protein [Moorena]|uniref:Uncharacterized protein n=2 Tax=Coleofasciculaceae TaxID=1892251 RepID=F4XZP1_9CYAN|nr:MULTISPECIES: hypothetical protein [Moorena]NES41707.1 hypothetical protein [Moorena sp. SIO2C4]EGJ30046.1 hypothetical protein LYNGBM3L_57370 [Moorena producens 3L]NEQ11414.1 hypothetical protein [Moorena sp. SIO4E2]NER88758.1 hypothetical protein [Moorena sp. SIO3A2]NET64196.1 hypothetical protein [Moorena sp. SIO1G6]
MQLGPGLLITFLYYFTCTTLITTVFSSQVLRLSLVTGMPYSVGIIFGLIGGLLGTYFNRTVTVSLEFRSKKVFTAALNDALTEMGFEETSKLDDFVVYQRPALSNLFSGKVFVQIGKGKATIASRSRNIKRISSKLSKN